MKRLLFIASICLSMQLWAQDNLAWYIKFADTQSLVNNVAKLGNMLGNPMMSMMATQAVQGNPLAMVYGEPRPGVGAMVAGIIENGEICYGVLYPVSSSKKEILANNSDAVESNGVIKVSCDMFAVFNKTGNWVAIAKDPRHARKILNFTKTAEQKIGGDIARAKVTRRALEQFDIDAHVKAEILKNVDTVGMAIKVTDAGIDIRKFVTVVKGSDLDKLSGQALDEKMFSNIPSGALYMLLGGKIDTCKNVDCNKFIEVLKKNGIDVSSFITYETKGGFIDVTIDPLSLVKYVNSQKDVKFDCEALRSDLENLSVSSEKAPCAKRMTLQVKNYKPAASVSKRLASTFPGVDFKKNHLVGFLSLASLVKALEPAILECIDEAEREQMKMLVFGALKQDNAAGIAWYSMKKGERHETFVRISSEEIKSVGPVISAIAMMQMMNKAQFQK